MPCRAVPAGVRYLTANGILSIVEDNKEDDPGASKRDHMAYYRSLCRTISEIKQEMGSEEDPTIRSHLDGRVRAMEQDLDRIKKMFPDVTPEEWDAEAAPGD